MSKFKNPSRPSALRHSLMHAKRNALIFVLAAGLLSAGATSRQVESANKMPPSPALAHKTTKASVTKTITASKTARQHAGGAVVSLVTLAVDLTALPEDAFGDHD